MKSNFSIGFDLFIIIGSFIMLFIFINRGYDIYVSLIPIATLITGIITLQFDFKKRKKWMYFISDKNKKDGI